MDFNEHRVVRQGNWDNRHVIKAAYRGGGGDGVKNTYLGGGVWPMEHDNMGSVWPLAFIPKGQPIATVRLFQHYRVVAVAGTAEAVLRRVGGKRAAIVAGVVEERQQIVQGNSGRCGSAIGVK